MWWLAGFALAACGSTGSAVDRARPLSNSSDEPTAPEPGKKDAADLDCADRGVVIHEISPGQGPAAGGTSVTVVGCGFMADGSSGVSIYFGRRSARVMAFESHTRLVVEPPPGVAGETVDVKIVFDDGRSFTYERAYTYGSAPML